MRVWGVVLLIVGILLLVAGFGSGWLVEEVVGEDMGMGMELSPANMQTMLDMADSMGDAAYSGMDSSELVGVAILRVYAKSDVVNMLGFVGVIAGVLMIVLGGRKKQAA